jgi:hypothetical protein
MQMRLLSVILLLAACGEVRQINRWPSHRREKDAEIERLGQQAVTLEARIKKLEEELATLRRRAEPPPAPAPGT